MYPVSGGLYSIVSYVLPKPLVFIAVFTFMIQAFIYPPSIAMGVAQYLQILFPQLPQGALACIRSRWALVENSRQIMSVRL